MKKIYLIKLYIKWNDKNVPTKDYRLYATNLMAYNKKDDAITSLKCAIKNAKKKQCDLYKNYFFIEEIVVH